MRRSIRVFVSSAAVLSLALVATLGTARAGQQSRLRFAITFPAERSAAPIDGRLLVMISADTAGEPRFQVSGTHRTAQVFGVDVEGWKPGETRFVDASAFGYPIASLALVNRYETFTRSDGHTVKLPPDRWEGQQWASKPRNLYSRPVGM